MPYLAYEKLPIIGGIVRYSFLHLLILLALYRLISMYLFGATIGMGFCRLRLLNEDYEALSASEKAFAAFYVLINGVNYYKK